MVYKYKLSLTVITSNDICGIYSLKGRFLCRNWYFHMWDYIILIIQKVKGIMEGEASVERTRYYSVYIPLAYNVCSSVYWYTKYIDNSSIHSFIPYLRLVLQYGLSQELCALSFLLLSVTYSVCAAVIGKCLDKVVS